MHDRVTERGPAPLAHLGGAAPDAPDWFEAAISTPYERHRLQVAGAEVEWLAWGDRGKPGLLLLHGNGAHADWWRFIAPFFAQTHRVAAPTWSGMGNSDHRQSYSLDIFVEEMLAVAAAAGLADTGPFTAVGHSFGGFPMMALANRPDAPLSQAIIIDTPFHPTMSRRPRRSGGDARPHHLYPTIAEALARFRWVPPQPTGNLFIADFIARNALRPADGGFVWKFDPFLWSDFKAQSDLDPLAAPHCPVTLMWGENSDLVTAGLVADMAQRLPTGSRLVPIPEAHHHVMVDQPLALVSAMRALIA